MSQQRDNAAGVHRGRGDLGATEKIEQAIYLRHDVSLLMDIILL